MRNSDDRLSPLTLSLALSPKTLPTNRLPNAPPIGGNDGREMGTKLDVISSAKVLRGRCRSVAQVSSTSLAESFAPHTWIQSGQRTRPSGMHSIQLPVFESCSKS